MKERLIEITFWLSVVIIPTVAITYLVKELIAGTRHRNDERDTGMIFLIEEGRRKR